MEIDTGWSVSSRWTGRLGIGAWHNTAHVPRHNGRIAKGLQGGYLLIDQTVWKSDVANDPRQIGLFIQIGATSPQTSDVKQVYATGMNWTGPIPSRAQDQFGIGIAMNRFSLVKGSGFIKPTETAIETYYVYQPFSWMNIQPDLQYIITPGGSDTPNALAVFLNMVVIF
jgi:porin